MALLTELFSASIPPLSILNRKSKGSSYDKLPDPHSSSTPAFFLFLSTISSFYHVFIFIHFVYSFPLLYSVHPFFLFLSWFFYRCSPPLFFLLLIIIVFVVFLSFSLFPSLFVYLSSWFSLLSPFFSCFLFMIILFSSFMYLPSYFSIPPFLIISLLF